MAEVKWIKIVTDIFDDEKILLVETLPEADSIIVIWFKLLCLAGKQNNKGVFMMNDKIPYTEKMLATIFRRKETTIQLALQTFENFGMIEIVNGVITIPNWSKHQNFDKIEKNNEYMRNYMREYRAKQKLLTQGVEEIEEDAEDTVNINSKPNSKSNVSGLDKNRIDKNRIEEDKNILSVNSLENEFEEIWSMYPKKQGKANAFKAYVKARKKGTTRETVWTGLGNYQTYIKANKISSQYIKNGSTWFNQECWKDDYSIVEEKQNNNPYVKQSGGNPFFDLLREEGKMQ